MLDVEEIAAAGNRIVQGDRFAPLPIRAQRALGICGFARPVASGPLATLAVAEFLPGPERIGLVRDSAGRGKVGLAPLFVSAHGTGNSAELFEVADPEIFIHIHVPVVALGGAAVGGHELQLRPIAEHNGVTGQLDVEPLFRESDDVGSEDIRLRPTR
ncbi:hypothetical protein D3C77_519290 [compost metagenome]